MLVSLLANLAHQPWIVIAGECAIAVAGAVGVVALVSPTLFARLAQAGATWFDTRPFFQRIDRPFYIDPPLMLHSRVFGLVVLAATIVLIWITPPDAAWSPLAWVVAAVLAVLGTTASIWPTCFRRLAAWGNTWIDTSRFVAVLDRRVDIDSFATRHSRTFGLCVLASILAMAALVYWR